MLCYDTEVAVASSMLYNKHHFLANFGLCFGHNFPLIFAPKMLCYDTEVAVASSMLYNKHHFLANFLAIIF
jgi:hypothetical protein